MISIKTFVFNEIAANCLVLYDETRECAVVDPGCNCEPEREKLKKFIESNSLKPAFILNTHGHFDHVFGNAWFKDLFQCQVIMHSDDLELIQHADKYAGLFGFEIDMPPVPDRLVAHGDRVHFGSSQLEIIHVPGHSPGSVCLYSREDRFVISGDVLFSGSIGRSDLPGGNHFLLVEGIREKLMTLPRDTVVWPGHGPHTTIGHEYDTNPFLN
ncbi:MAG: MBL fold metallo-hydrolase [Bacteroidales bacterium]|nr:MBL fold metallo-hydrolase [Bacteroidales bacterium]